MSHKNVEKKYIYCAFHQVFTVAMVICLYLYDYALRIDTNLDEMGYLMIAFIGLLGSIASLVEFSKIENYIAKKWKRKSRLDRFYLEGIVILVLLSVSVFIWILLKINIQYFTLPGLAITIGILAYLTDVVLLIGYINVLRRVARNDLLSGSLVYRIWQIFCNYTKGAGWKESSLKSVEQIKLKETLEQIANGEIDMKLDVEQFHGLEKEMAIAINQIQNGLKEAVASRTKDEKMKADLITNVSHDIKTPLTSIVNYVELLKRENLENDNAKKYIRIISDKTQRLKHLTEDLVEVSKISSGNIKLDKHRIDFMELIYQTGGEFNERLENKNLTIITKMPPKSVFIEVDGRQLYRIVENLYSNVVKYSLENTKVYVDLMVEDTTVIFRIKNISKYTIEVPNGNYEDLTERFVRGEISRTTEGSGLGLSIAKTLTELMGGNFAIKVDRDMFMAQITFPVANNS